MTPIVADIRDSFETKPSQCMVSSHPTRAEVKKLRKAIKTNLKRLPCVPPGTEETGWSWIPMSTAQWDALQQTIVNRNNEKENNQPEATTNQEETTDENTAESTTKTPKKPAECPECDNPMKFDSKNKEN